MIGIHEETGSAPVDPRPSQIGELTARIFEPGGWLQASMDLEHRGEQQTMAEAVAAAFVEDSNLVFEAGTGVGKSLAYLVPGIIQAVDQERQMILSTHTISLQEQIESKDLALCRRLFAGVPELSPYTKFKSAVLLGKANYLCTTRLATALTEPGTLIADGDVAELQRITAWAKDTLTGLRHELQPPPRAEVWDAVNADSAACSRKHCDCTKCFYQRARARLRTAQVIIVNHALLFALINAGGAAGTGEDAKGVLFPDDFLVLDEAHTVPEVATDNFGLGLSSFGVDRMLKQLFNPRTTRGLFCRKGGPDAQLAVIDALQASEQFFGAIDGGLLAQRPVVRLLEPNPVEAMLDAPLGTVHRMLDKLAAALEDGRERDEVLEHRQRVKGMQASLNEWLERADAGQVYWAERGGRKQTTVMLRSAPLDVAPLLRKHLFGRGVSVVCTSATLAVGGEIAPFVSRIGADGAEAVVVNSPFDFERNMRVYVAADVPLPSPKEARLSIESLTDYIAFCTRRVAGGSLVLFTSYSDMRAVANGVEQAYREAGRPFLMQGADLSRTELARQMRKLGNAVLFGTDSFWTGVDVPGDALSQVIITRLPFDPPTHPVTEARSQRIQEDGGSPFNELTLPDALIKFRQGVGRLIRSHSDRGIVTILDSRVLAKSYGRLFVESLPKTQFEQLTIANREARFRPFV